VQVRWVPFFNSRFRAIIFVQGGIPCRNTKRTPYDGHHTQGDSESSWRTNAAERFVGYGNWAGPGNRMDHEEADYIKPSSGQRDPNYDPYVDPHMLNNPRYQATDGMDAAAQRP
jgi:hypothetical protein